MVVCLQFESSIACDWRFFKGKTALIAPWFFINCLKNNHIGVCN